MEWPSPLGTSGRLDARENSEHLAILAEWMRSYRPEELFTDAGAPVIEVAQLHPVGQRRMSANPHANGGALLVDLKLQDFRDYAVDVDVPGTGAVESTKVLGGFLRDVMAHNMDVFRMFSPDRTTRTGFRTCSR